MQILFIEEDAQNYLKNRQVLDEQASQLNIDWAPNYEIASKRIKKNHYDVFLVGYDAKNTQQQKFLNRLYQSVAVPTILLTKNNESVDSQWMDKYHTDFLDKYQFSWQMLERSIRYLSNLITLQEKKNQFQTIFDNAFEFMGLLKADGILQEINHKALTLIDAKREAVIGLPLWKTPWATRTYTQKQFKAAIITAKKGKSTHCEVEIEKQNGQLIMLNFSFTPIANAQQEIISILIEGYDLGERQALEQQLTYAHLYDQLTGLPNRHQFMEHLEQAMTRAQQHQKYSLAVLFLDLDRFKMINTSLGHDMGDWLLMEIAERLQACLNKGNVLARSGGDEFLILLDDMQDLAEATRLAATINKVLAGPFLLEGYKVVTSASIGIAYYTTQEECAELLRDADTAMYRAKARGKSCYVVFRHGMHDQAVSRLQIEADLHQAIEKQQFVLFYQPQIELSTGNLVGTESLIRFRHPHNGLFLTVDFTPVLEDTGIIITVGEWILQTACKQLKAWLDADLLISQVAVNLSSHQFRNKRLINVVAETLKISGLAPEYLELEITESLLLEDIDTAIKTLKCFKDMGIRVTIDDFGTGYASLNYLKRFPIDCLKIDNTFIEGIISSPADATITVATIDMAHALGLTVIAKGVETTEQRDFLQDHGCDFAQGELYAEPMENTAFLEWGKQFHRASSKSTVIS